MITITVVRPTIVADGLADIYIHLDGQQIFKGRTKTGGAILDPHRLGGVTPYGDYILVEPIDRRRHPRGTTFRFGRFIPTGPIRSSHRSRTWDLEKVPFMVHYGGSSTGCIAVLPKWWPNFYKVINKYFRYHTVKISVVKQAPWERMTVPTQATLAAQVGRVTVAKSLRPAPTLTKSISPNFLSESEPYRLGDDESESG